VSKRKSIGYITDDQHTGIPQMADIESRLLGEIPQVSHAMLAYGLSMWAFMRFVTRRTQSSALFPVCLLVHRPLFATWANALQDKCAHAILNMRNRQKRAAILHELGWKMRWSTLLTAEAIMMHKRAHTFDKYKHFVPILEVASTTRTTWTAHVVAVNDQWRLHKIGSRLPVHAKSVQAAKDQLKMQKKSIVIPAAISHDDEVWWSLPTQREALQEIRPGWTVSAAISSGCSLHDSQRWAQLRMQGHFTRNTAHPDSSDETCRICKGGMLESERHLMLECPGCMPTFVEFCHEHSFALGPEAGEDWVAQVLGCCEYENLPFLVQLTGTLS
jgi:hypothetical protein